MKALQKLALFGLLASLGISGCSCDDEATNDGGVDASVNLDATVRMDASVTPDSGPRADAAVDGGVRMDATVTPDSGTPDSGTPDTGVADTGTADGGMIDGGTPDGGTPDGGEDFATFVKDLINNHTADNTQPVQINGRTFSDSQNAAAFQQYFP